MKIDQLCSERNGVAISAMAHSQGLADRRDIALVAVERTRMPMAVSDPRLPDNPVVLANQAFLDLCGYQADEVIGRNCRFLQGRDTDQQAVARLRRAVKEQEEIEVELLNYRKDGSAFWNKVFISPIHNEAGDLIYFFASQKDQTAKHRAKHLEHVQRQLLKEVDHRTKNALALVQSVVLLSQRPDIQSFANSIEGRVGSIVKSHVLLADNDWADMSLREVFESAAEGSQSGAVIISGPDIPVGATLVQPLALTIHEIFDNAAKYGAMSVVDGRMHIQWTCDWENRSIAIEFDECGGPAPSSNRRPGLGTRLIGRLVGHQLHGKAQFEFRPTGLRTTLSIPMI